MTWNQTPQQAVKALARGEAPERPLLLPIIFSLGSKLESVPYLDYLSNPTKIANALRRIHNFLRCDGIACYFDPYLEAEALGCKLEPGKRDGLPQIVERPFAGKEHSRCNVTWDELKKRGRIEIAIDAVRRLKLMLRGEAALMASVAGPLSLSSKLSGLDPSDSQTVSATSFPLPLVESAAEVTLMISTKFVEAGADVLFVVEDDLPRFSLEFFDWWRSLLSPVCNIARFYESLPVLLVRNSGSLLKNKDSLLDREWECVLCPTLSDLRLLREMTESKRAKLGLALPLEMFESDESKCEDPLPTIRQTIKSYKPLLVTTAWDIPSTVNVKRLFNIIDSLRDISYL